MKKFFKQLFCRHKYNHSISYLYVVKTCRKCGKIGYYQSKGSSLPHSIG